MSCFSCNQKITIKDKILLIESYKINRLINFVYFLRLLARDINEHLSFMALKFMLFFSTIEGTESKQQHDICNGLHQYPFTVTAICIKNEYIPGWLKNMIRLWENVGGYPVHPCESENLVISSVSPILNVEIVIQE